MATIKQIARRQLAEGGTGGLSLRAIARDMQLSPGALFRYFANQAELITELCVDANNALAEAVIGATSKAEASGPRAQWLAGCHAARSWALTHPSDFAMINGTPIPQFEARTEDTGPSAVRIISAVAAPYLAAVASGAADPANTQMIGIKAGPLLRALLGDVADTAGPVPAVVMSAWMSVLGFIAAEVFGSVDQLVADADQFYECHLATVTLGMGFTPADL